MSDAMQCITDREAGETASFTSISAAYFDIKK
jgi:hypothetical protein